MNIAFCAPFYGHQAAGGAEAECRKTVLHLHRAGINIEIFTTCLIDLQHDWNINAYPAGTTREDGIIIHRFPAEKCILPVFSALNQRLMNKEKLSIKEENTFLALHINSTLLLKALDEQKDRFEWVFFIPYLFGTTVHGIQVCGGKSILIPCLHDEGYARISRFNQPFRTASRIIFHTEAEQKLAHTLYDYNPAKDRLIGEGITTHFDSNPERFQKKFNIRTPFILCAGRKNDSKNTPLLIDFFEKYKRANDNNLKLILIGPGSVKIPSDMPDIMDLGYLSEQDKRDAYSSATLFCQPSLNESFSIVLMEAWDCQTPALIHGHCTVTKEHVQKSNGGLWFSNAREFADATNWILTHPDQAHAMGQAGQHYVRSNFTWDTIVKKYQTHAL